jgi:hypothetical protein
MPDVIGAEKDPDLSVAYQALERRREEAIVQRDLIADELKRLDAALDALRALVGNAPGPAAVNGQEAALPASESAEPTRERTKAEAELSAETAKGGDRKARVSQFLLESPRQWFTVAEIADVTEQGNASATQRNAVYKALRILLSREAVQRDDTGSVAKYRAVPAVLRELLLAAQ